MTGFRYIGPSPVEHGSEQWDDMAMDVASAEALQ